ncbi:aminopeptidase P family N-terminal domain-containing protein, partial [Frateuria sp.]|uniref:aminopeptidase P family N-terminal domain-containing protein n=1 Tax=Frateuria sp. TaxID=2211372 RepID=UPI001852B022
MTTPITSRLAALRQAMQRHGVAACLVPTADPHLSEYLPTHWAAREWLSGFTGSAGTLVVTATDADLWTDSRYFFQAEQQLAGSGIALKKQKASQASEHLQWLQQHLHEGNVLAVAGDSLSVASRRQIERLLGEAGARARTDLDLPGEVWADRP